MRLLFLTVFAFLLLSCSSDQHDIDRGIAEMEGEEIVEQEDTTNVLETCLFDTSYYKLTMAALAGIPDAKDVRWIESEHTAVVNWRGDEIRRSRGGCDQFNDNLVLTARATKSFEDVEYWLRRGRDAAKHFGIPYVAPAIDSGLYQTDIESSDHSTHYFTLTPRGLEPGQIIEPIRIDQLGESVRVTILLYKM